jgi:hypothetical protein
LEAAEAAELGDDIIGLLRRKVEEARKERDNTMPPEQLRSRLQQRVCAKEASLAKAHEHAELCKAELEKATVELNKRKEELERLQTELASHALDADEVSCEGEDEALEPEFRGCIDVVRLHRQLERAKSSVRAGERPGTPGAPDAGEMDLDLEFEGGDIPDEILEELGVTQDGVGEATRSAKKNKLAEFVQECSRKKTANETDRWRRQAGGPQGVRLVGRTGCLGVGTRRAVGGNIANIAGCAVDTLACASGRHPIQGHLVWTTQTFNLRTRTLSMAGAMSLPPRRHARPLVRLVK